MTTTNNRIEQVSEVASILFATAWGAPASDDERMDGLINHLVTYNLDIDQLYYFNSILSEMDLHDRVNGPINRLLACKTDKALTVLNDFYKAYADGEIDEVLEHLDLDATDLLEYVNYATPDCWHDLADADLKENGMDANALYWLDEIDHSEEWQVLNAYENGFSNYDSMHEMLMHYCDDEIFDALDEAIKDANGDNE